MTSRHGKRRESNDGKRFESYIQYIYQTLVAAQGKNIAVTRGARVSDNRGRIYSIDVYYEFEVAGVPHRVAIECKDTARPVERDDAIAFAGKLQDMPSTIGIFISNAGFQPGAKAYLSDHGILHYSGDDLPHFGAVIATRISPLVFPSKSAVGQPFWTLMHVDENGTTCGEWCLLPDPQGNSTEPDGLLPLFFSKQKAERFRKAIFRPCTAIAVRGVEQPMLRFLIRWGGSEGRRFAVFLEGHGGGEFPYGLYSARELEQEYSAEDHTRMY